MSQDPQKSAPPRAQALLAVVMLLGFLIVCVVSLAVVETVTSAKPISYFLAQAMGTGNGSQNDAVPVITLVPTYTPTFASVAEVSTPYPATNTPKPSPTTTPIRTETPTLPTPTWTPPAATNTPIIIIPTDSPSPVPMEEPTATPTETTTHTPTVISTETATETPDAQATKTAIVQITATARVKNRAASQATATAEAAPTKTRATATRKPPPLPPPEGRIAFPVFNTTKATYDVFIANIDGSAQQLVMDNASQPSRSPNGRDLAFRRWKSDERGIETVNLDGTGLKRLSTFLEDATPAWTADGGHLLFFSRRESDRQSRVYRVDFHAGDEQTLTEGGSAVYGEMPSAMPDGRIIYRTTFPASGIAVMNGDGSNRIMVVEDGSATAPAASPNGNVILFMSQRDNGWEIYRIQVDGSGLKRLTENAANDGLPTWSPDGRYIAFASDRDGQWSIWVMNANGGNQRRMFALPGPLDGRVTREPEFITRGWIEERLSWQP